MAAAMGAVLLGMGLYVITRLLDPFDQMLRTDQASVALALIAFVLCATGVAAFAAAVVFATKKEPKDPPQ